MVACSGCLDWAARESEVCAVRCNLTPGLFLELQK